MAPRYNVLVVDDEADIAESARDVLEQLVPGCHVVTASSAGAARAAIRQTPFDALLVDYRMPDGDGLQLITSFHHEEPDVPAILMTAYASIEMATEAVNAAHVDGFLAKPIDAARLAHAVEEALQRGCATPAADTQPVRW